MSQEDERTVKFKVCLRTDDVDELEVDLDVKFPIKKKGWFQPYASGVMQKLTETAIVGATVYFFTQYGGQIKALISSLF